MKKSKSGRVPVLEQAFEINLPKLMRAAKAAGSDRLVVDDGNVRTVVLLSETRLAVMLSGRAWVATIATVPCLGGRLRPLLKCPRAHEGNFQSLYYRAGELACRHCHELRYRSGLASTAVARARLARQKLLEAMRGRPSDAIPDRRPGAWRSRHKRLEARLAALTSIHYSAIRSHLQSSATGVG